jgi:hypothetical protein
VFEPLRTGERLALGAGAMPARATECSGATQLDRAHRAPLGATEPAGMG